MPTEAPPTQPPPDAAPARAAPAYAAKNVAFRSPLANVIFGSAADPTRERFEAGCVERFTAALGQASSNAIFKQAPFLDAGLVLLSGRNKLAVAKLIEARAPAAIENMPELRKDREHLRKAAELEQILSPTSIAQMIAALAADLEMRGIR
jgi:hypothetical protein